MKHTVKTEEIDGQKIEVKVYKKNASGIKKDKFELKIIEKDGVWIVASNKGEIYGKFNKLRWARSFLKKYKMKLLDNKDKKPKITYGYNTSKG